MRDMVRLKRVSCSAPGIRRVRSGKGFRYLDAAGRPVRDAAVLERIRIAHRKSKGRYGEPRVTAQLARTGEPVT